MFLGLTGAPPNSTYQPVPSCAKELGSKMVAGRGGAERNFPTSEIHHFVMAITAAQAMSRHDVSVWMRRSFPATGGDGHDRGIGSRACRCCARITLTRHGDRWSARI